MELALQQTTKVQKKILLFVTRYHLLSEIFKAPAIVSYKKGKSLRDILVRV